MSWVKKTGRLYAADSVSVQHSGYTMPDSVIAITTDESLSGNSIEASGIYFDRKMNTFFIVSDDTPNKSPIIYTMNDAAKVTGAVSISGIEKINDLEGMTCDQNGMFYFIASQSFNKHGTLPESRTVFLRTVWNGKEFSIQETIHLYGLLLEAAKKRPDTEWAHFILSADKKNRIDIEGIALTDDTLLLGFKNPKINGHAIIIGIRESGILFTTGVLHPEHVCIWRELLLRDTISGVECGISDLYMHSNGTLAGVATGTYNNKQYKDEDVGLFWLYNTQSDDLYIVKHFHGMKPEGVTFNPDLKEYCIVFDNGSKRSSCYLKVKASL